MEKIRLLAIKLIENNLYGHLALPTNSYLPT
jgi:hypothetical protein